MDEFAWLVPHCPNFYFMPSLFYHQLFKVWDDGSRNFPAYWMGRGVPPIACYKTEDEVEAQCWISKRKGKWDTECYVKGSGLTCSFWSEALNATRRQADETHLLRFPLVSSLTCV
jgi:hypothetical protein